MVSLETFFFIIRRPLSSTLFPYTTLFRSISVLGQIFAGIFPVAVPVNPAQVELLYQTVLDCRPVQHVDEQRPGTFQDRKSTRLNSSHPSISYAGFCLKKKTALYSY